MVLMMRKGERILTRDRSNSGSFYGEKLEDIDGQSFREWIPWRSKLGALLRKEEDQVFPHGDVLYLGAAQGTTVSHISDLLPDNRIFAVEFSKVPFRKLAHLAGKRDNIIPILADAFHPERYSAMVPEVDILYQDVSQKDQVGMFLRNADMFLKNGGSSYLMLKARSNDVTSAPERIYEKAVKQLKENGCSQINVVDLSPFQVDHSAILFTYNR